MFFSTVGSVANVPGPGGVLGGGAGLAAAGLLFGDKSTLISTNPDGNIPS